MKKIILKNGIPFITKENKLTPRIAFCFYMSINENEKYAGEIALIKALLFQGTKTKNGEQLACALEENGIECSISSTKDYLCFNLLCLNEDFPLAIDILKDMIFNSTFEAFEKERIKIKGEILSDLDSPQVQAFDGFTKTIFKNHAYGNSRSVILKEIDNLTTEDVKAYYQNIIEKSVKNISVVGDFEQVGGYEGLENLVYEAFKDLKNFDKKSQIEVPLLNNKNIVTKTKKDTAQAQVIQGWIFPSITHSDSPAIHVMNTILGSSGLSSRLFLELREKKGLAYTVRSSYDIFDKCGCLWVYIGTNPVNIQTAVEGFKVEIDKLKSTPVSDEELLGGKNNILGKRQFILETNMRQAASMGLYEFIGVGYDFESKYQRLVNDVTADDIMRVANKYFTEDYVLYILSSNVNLNL